MRRWFTYARGLSFVVICFTHSFVTGEPFFFALSPPIATNSVRAITADINGDGYPDIISRDLGGSTLSVLTNDHQNGFSLSTPIVLTNFLIGFAAADVNQDNWQDVIVTHGWPGPLSVMTNDGAGGFALGSSPAVEAKSVIPADVNGDGLIDLITLHDGGRFAALTNSGGGQFSLAHSSIIFYYPIGMVAADFNRDSSIDVITIESEGPPMLFTNTGNGTFVSGPNPVFTAQANSIATGDVNNDGAMDLMVGTRDGLQILTNNGSGRFTVAANPALIGGRDSLAAADVNGDGWLDIIAPESSAHRLAVLTNNGAGSFSVADYVAGKRNAYRVVATDLNNDQRVDLLSLGWDSAALSVHWNFPGPFLNAQRTQSNAVVVCWPLTGPGWRLESTANLSGNPGVVESNFPALSYQWPQASIC